MFLCALKLHRVIVVLICIAEICTHGLHHFPLHWYFNTTCFMSQLCCDLHIRFWLYWFCLLSAIQQNIDYKFSVVSRHRTLMNIFDKAPAVDKDAFVAPSASVIGDVQVGRGSSIWYGCVLRGKNLYVWILVCIQNLKLWHWAFFCIWTAWARLMKILIYICLFSKRAMLKPKFRLDC